MKKFEYRYLIIEKYGKGIFGFVLPSDISWKVHYVNGKVLQNWTDVTVFNYLNEVGGEGWEVATSVSHMNVRSGALPEDQIHMVLKRESE